MDLREHGRGEDVLRGREAFNETAAPELEEIVERITGQAVEAVLCSSHLDPDKTAIVLLLQAGHERGRARIDALLAQASEQHEASRAVLAESRQAMQRTTARRAERNR